MTAQTMFDKIWSRHEVAEEDGELLLYVDRALIHEGSSHAFAALAAQGRTVARPRQIFAFNDHYVPTTGRDKGVAGIANPEIRNMVIKLASNATEHGITHFGIDDPRQGILHIVPPELGITQPGLLIVGADSHTDADHLAAQTEDHAYRRGRCDGLWRHGERRDPLDHREDRCWRRHRPRDRVRGVGDRGDEHGSAHDRVQYVDRGGRPRRHDSARRHHVRVHERSPVCAGRQGMG
jgi:hypothetical protein